MNKVTDEILIDFIYKLLDDAEHKRIEGLLEDDIELQERIKFLESKLGQLDDLDNEMPVPEDLLKAVKETAYKALKTPTPIKRKPYFNKADRFKIAMVAVLLFTVLGILRFVDFDYADYSRYGIYRNDLAQLQV